MGLLVPASRAVVAATTRLARDRVAQVGADLVRVPEPVPQAM